LAVAWAKMTIGLRLSAAITENPSFRGMPVLTGLHNYGG